MKGTIMAKSAGSAWPLEKGVSIRSSSASKATKIFGSSVCAGRQTPRLNAMKHKATSKRKYRLNTPGEEARIRAGIKADSDTRELTERDMARLRPFGEIIKRGRPKSAVHKEPVTVRLDPEVVGFFRA